VERREVMGELHWRRKRAAEASKHSVTQSPEGAAAGWQATVAGHNKELEKQKRVQEGAD
jgi:hypothetical protein